jgi:dTDP-glucose 4,6-dehydratase
MEKILITGGCGFIGHHVIEHFLKMTTWRIMTFDKLTYAARGLDRVRDIKAFDEGRMAFYAVDFTRPISEGIYRECRDVNYILHLGAETHVDNSITDALPFVYSNVVGTAHMLEFARKCSKLKAFIYFSTDEVFGPAPDGVAYKEWDRYNSTNPYSATKAGGEELTLAYMNTYALPGFITHTMNVIGERQHPEKYLPKCIRYAQEGRTLSIHGSPEGRPGSRFYIHARNVAAAIHWLLDKFEQREKYNVVGEREMDNLELAQLVASVVGKPLEYEVVDFHTSRPGHDLRYALDGGKLAEVGWTPPRTIEETVASTVRWTLEHPEWLSTAAPPAPRKKPQPPDWVKEKYQKRRQQGTNIGRQAYGSKSDTMK